jgi:hypothetical protein
MISSSNLNNNISSKISSRSTESNMGSKHNTNSSKAATATAAKEETS